MMVITMHGTNNIKFINSFHILPLKGSHTCKSRGSSSYSMKSVALVRAIPTYESKQKMELCSRISHKQHVVLKASSSVVLKTVKGLAQGNFFLFASKYLLA
jgi:hypothetical protein